MIVILIIIGMSFATMIPRMIPSFIVDKLEFKPWLNRWLHAIPYAALGALIFPGVLSVQEGEPMIGLMGAIVAIILAFLKFNVIFVVIGSIFVVYLLSL